MKIFTRERVLTPSQDLVSPSLQLIKKYIWPLMYLAFLPTLLLSVGSVLLGKDPRELSDGRETAGFTLLAFAGLWTLLAYPGYLQMQLHAARGKEVEAWECFKKGLPKVLPFIGMSIVAGILVICGFILLIVPGLILIRGFLLSPYYLVDQNLGPIEALKQSFNDSRPVTGWLWGVIGISAVFGFLSSALQNLPVVGPIVGLAIGYIYSFATPIRYEEIVHDYKLKPIEA